MSSVKARTEHQVLAHLQDGKIWVLTEVHTGTQALSPPAPHLPSLPSTLSVKVKPHTWVTCTHPRLQVLSGRVSKQSEGARLPETPIHNCRLAKVSSHCIFRPDSSFQSRESANETNWCRRRPASPFWEHRTGTSGSVSTQCPCKALAPPGLPTGLGGSPGPQPLLRAQACPVRPWAFKSPVNTLQAD